MESLKMNEQSYHEFLEELVNQSIENIKTGNPSLQNLEDSCKRNKDIVLAAVSRDSEQFQYASDDLRKNKNFILNLCVIARADFFRYVDSEIKDNPIFMRLVVSIKGEFLKYASDNLRDNKDVVTSAVYNDGQALRYASYELKDDDDIVWIAIKNNARAFEYASERLRGKKEFIEEAVKHYGYAFFHITEDPSSEDNMDIDVAESNENEIISNDNLKLNTDIVLLAVSANEGYRDILNYVDEQFTDNYEIGLAAVQNEGLAFQFLSPRLRDDFTIAQIALSDDDNMYEYLSTNLKNNDKLRQLAKKNNHSKPKLLNTMKSMLDDLKTSDRNSFHRRYHKKFDKKLFDHKYGMLLFLQKTGYGIEYASDRLKDHKKIAIAGVTNYGGNLKFVSKRLQDDEEVVLNALSEDREFLKFASDRLKKDNAFLLRSFFHFNYTNKNQWQAQFNFHTLPQYLCEQSLYNAVLVEKHTLNQTKYDFLNLSMYILNQWLQLLRLQVFHNDPNQSKLKIKRHIPLFNSSKDVKSNPLLNIISYFNVKDILISMCLKKNDYNILFRLDLPHLKNIESYKTLALKGLDHVKNNEYTFLSFVDKSLRSDKDFVLKALSVHKNKSSFGDIFKYIDESLFSNPEFIKSAIEIYSEIFTYAHLNVRNNEETAILAIKHNIRYYLFVGSILRDSDKFLERCKREVGGFLNCYKLLNIQSPFVDKLSIFVAPPKQNSSDNNHRRKANY